MALLRSSKCRNQNKWITKYILEHAEATESPFLAQTAKVVKHVAGPLIDGSIIKEVSDHSVYIKAVFTAEALQEQESEDDSQIDWSKAVIIIRKCSLIFRFHQRLEYCEFMLKVNEFQIWDLQHGFELKSKVKFCMEDRLVCDKSKLKWKEIEDKCSATSWVDEASRKTFAENANLKQLKADFKINEFIISKDQEKVLDDIAEWKKDFIPSQNSNSSNLDPFLLGSSDSLSAIPSGQPNQSNRQQNPSSLISSTCDNSDLQQSASPDKDITDRDQLNSCHVNSEVTDFSKSVVCGMKNKDIRSTSLGTDDNFYITSSDEFATSTQEFVPDLTDSEARLSDVPFVTQEFQPQLTQGSLNSGYTDTTGTQQFIPQGNGSGNFSPNLSRESNNVSLSSETSPVLIASSGETSQKRTESRKTSTECMNESGSTKSSGDLVFSMKPPPLHSSSPESSDSPRLLEMSKSAKKTFQDYFEMSIENVRLNSMAKKSNSISKKRINFDSDSTDDEMARKKQKTMEPSDNNETKRNREKKGFISNVVNRLWQYMGSSTDSQSLHTSDDKDKQQIAINEERKDNSQIGSCEQQKEVQEKNSSQKKKNVIEIKRALNATESPPSNVRVTRNCSVSSTSNQGTKSSVVTTRKKDDTCKPSGKVIPSSEASEPSDGVMPLSEETSQRDESREPSGEVMPSDEETSQRVEGREPSGEVIPSDEKTSQRVADSGMLPSVERPSPEKRNQPSFHRSSLRRENLCQKSKNLSQESPSQKKSSNSSESRKPDENSPFKSRYPENKKNDVAKSIIPRKELDKKGKKCQLQKTGHQGEDIKECSVSSPKTRSKNQVKQISELSDESSQEESQSLIGKVSKTIQPNKASNRLSLHGMKGQDKRGNLERNRKRSPENHEEERDHQEEVTADQQEDVIIISSNEVVHSDKECATPSSKKSPAKTNSMFMLPEYPLPTTDTGKRLMNLKFPSQLLDDIFNICSS